MESLATLAERITQVLHSLIFRALRSALLMGEPSITEILGRFFRRYHSLHTISGHCSATHGGNLFGPFEEVCISQDNNVSQVIVADITRSQWHQQVSKEGKISLITIQPASQPQCSLQIPDVSVSFLDKNNPQETDGKV